MTTDYRFIDKDPVLGVIRTAMQRQGNLSHEQIAKVAYDAGVHPHTIWSWLNGETRRPLSITTRFVLEALGVNITYEQDGRAIREAKPELISTAAQREIMAKDREREKAREAKKK
jgi:hypothetical protein